MNNSPVRQELSSVTGQVIRIADSVEFQGPVKFEELSETPLEFTKTGDTTPTVLNLERIKFQNTSPVTVTNFDNGREGQYIVVVGDGQTIIQHGTNIFNTAGVDITLANGRVYAYVRVQGVWREQGGTPSISLSSLTAARASDLALTTSNVWVDAVTLSLTAGTWLINAHSTVRNTLGFVVIYAARISVTTPRASTQITTPAAADANGSMSLTCLVTIASTTNAILQIITNTGDPANLLKATTNISGSGNNATQVTALRIG